MIKSKNILKAYEDQDFLTSPDGRIIRILSEFLQPQARFKRHKIVDTIVFFGSARLQSKKDSMAEYNRLKKSDPKSVRNFAEELRKVQRKVEMSRYYDDAVELARRLTKWSLGLDTEGRRFTICTGGGPGIMEAANKGAKLAGGKSIGLNISIPFEQFVNKYVPPDLSFEFHYFFMRKFWFAYLAKSLIVFPGGFGTMDEFLEILTLIQTGKIKKKMLLLVYDEKYWGKIINFKALSDNGMISPDDSKLFSFCNTVDEAFEMITNFFEKTYLSRKEEKKLEEPILHLE
jgi:uncharacterized protein (TIGR00730 family)